MSSILAAGQSSTRIYPTEQEQRYWYNALRIYPLSTEKQNRAEKYGERNMSFVGRVTGSARDPSKAPPADGDARAAVAARHELLPIPGRKVDAVEGLTEAHRGVQEPLQREIAAADLSRRTKLRDLPQEVTHSIETLERTLQTVEAFSLRICGLKKELASLDIGHSSTDTVDASIDEAETEMTEFITAFVKDHPALGMNFGWFSDWWNIHKVQDLELALGFMKAQMLNRCFNKLCFLSEVKTILEAKKGTIIEQFSREKPAPNPKEVTFELAPHVSETHNGGKIPTKVTFNLGDRELFSIFFKYRDAAIDAAVIEVFRALNDLPEADKSSETLLPTYRIVNDVDRDGHPFSLWEFIEGGQSPEGTTASEFVENRKAPAEQKCLHDQLMRLETACRFLGVSDLHRDNVIFSRLETPESRMVPIDLESIQPGASTGLFRNPPASHDLFTFTQEEKVLLARCRDSFDTMVGRFVPIVTTHFLGSLPRYDSFVDLAQLVRQAIEEKKYALSISMCKLESLILIDMLNNDVPYLTERGKVISYMSKGQAQEIARRR